MTYNDLFANQNLYDNDHVLEKEEDKFKMQVAFISMISMYSSYYQILQSWGQNSHPYTSDVKAKMNDTNLFYQDVCQA